MKSGSLKRMRWAKSILVTVAVFLVAWTTSAAFAQRAIEPGPSFGQTQEISASIAEPSLERAAEDPQTGEKNSSTQSSKGKTKANEPKALSEFDENRAFGYLKEVCKIGPRISASQGMWQQQEFLKKHFTSLGAAVYFQKFDVRHPQTGAQVTLANMIVRWHPDRRKRLLICCHYDTRPFPDQDTVNPQGIFIGANDGGSGVGLLCELGNHLADLPGKYGIDLVFFDGEEFVFVHRRDPMFLGSTYFANQYAAGQFNVQYRYGILIDMVADKNLEIYYEGNSMDYAPRLTRSIWSVAAELGIKEFKQSQRHKIRDDHLPLNSIAKIQTCDIIDFDYPTEGNAYWHTEKDVVENCSAESLGKVGKVVLQWLRQMSEQR